MKKLFLCGIAVLALSLTPAVQADNLLFNDDITLGTYTPSGSSIDGKNGWNTTSGTMNFLDSSDNGIFQSANSNDAIATHAFTTLPDAGDTILSALFFGRFRPTADATGYKTLMALRDSTSEVLAFGTDGAGDFLSGTGLTYTAGTSPFTTGGHEYVQFRLAYDEAGGGMGTLFAALDTSAGAGTSFGAEVTAATFTGSIDVSSLRSLSVTSSEGADRIGSINVQSVPEPGSLALGLMCLAGLATRRRRS